MLSATTGGLLALAILPMQQEHSLTVSSQVNASTLERSLPQAAPEPEPGVRYQFTYQQWLAQLQREAERFAEKPPKRLIVLAGDSLSLWFPYDLLPRGVTWLNQGISGETSAGLLQRLDLFDDTKPETILVMVGINDIIRGVRDATLLANQVEIIRHLKRSHPRSRIVVQSLLPHGGPQITQRYTKSAEQTTTANPPSLPVWVDRLPKVPNRHIRWLNRELAAIAKEEQVEYLDLHSFFTDIRGDLRDDLSTDGLHLSPKGYQVWRSQLQKFSQDRPN
ncbi:SGNH/GDSL hydrolase family protein [Pantanalinema sp. GBBB05]|uniref:SGNH/GDSL hydrolase family protein n=1 Tax=Pantanalinema sp. GBBB05 TaxID=2604139 RepID=UPI001D8B3A82|nr:G-D-S-L family lipolytic protein [Pantanalinema sp. GBBB05]